MDDLDRQLVLDANAAAGVLREIFGAEMTASSTECASCGNHGALGTLLAFMQGPGVVLRCSACDAVMIRIVQTPDGTLIDARGAVYLQVPRHTA